MRRRDHEELGFIPFADLAMAVVGPVAGLMLIFMILAAALLHPDCRQLRTDEDRERLRSELIRWLEARQTAIESDRRSVKMQCPGLAPESSDSSLEHFVPDPLDGYCRTDVEDIVASLPADLRRVEKEYREAYATVRTCLGLSPEIIEVPSDELEFIDCRTEFQRVGTLQPLPREEITAFFASLMAKVADRLRQRQYNRIDIFGHSDQRRISQDRGSEGVFDNERLSSLRAHRFRDELVRALREGNFGDLEKRLDTDQLRIYAIGVGSAEPKFSDAKTPEEFAKNRRIELRLVRDFRRETTP